MRIAVQSETLSEAIDDKRCLLANDIPVRCESLTNWKCELYAAERREERKNKSTRENKGERFTLQLRLWIRGVEKEFILGNGNAGSVQRKVFTVFTVDFVGTFCFQHLKVLNKYFFQPPIWGSCSTCFCFWNNMSVVFCCFPAETSYLHILTIS